MLLSWTHSWTNSRVAGNLRCHNGHWTRVVLINALIRYSGKHCTTSYRNGPIDLLKRHPWNQIPLRLSIYVGRCLYHVYHHVCTIKLLSEFSVISLQKGYNKTEVAVVLPAYPEIYSALCKSNEQPTSGAGVIWPKLWSYTCSLYIQQMIGSNRFNTLRPNKLAAIFRRYFRIHLLEWKLLRFN